ncbi:hypothetical protein LRS03_05605 [Rhizobacter sp. J219]|jgi:hypothetical protein|uniref:hypothetical protein n=1 Tax=Rhizobacter sp. J219 TaxID=2898430 RepID=UPI0021516655|nr:hypothetical protein [Rhizobacter sp. J219]MCR5882362.1 hypothetical protein [Rhizobacter sp. J219]
MSTPAQHNAPRNDKHRDELERERRALLERARQLGTTAEELGAELDALALQAEAVLHRLRGGRLH